MLSRKYAQIVPACAAAGVGSCMQCDRCDKWRIAPYEITLPSWVCEQNTWDRRYASCSVPEQPDPAAPMQQQQQQPTRSQQQLLQQQQLQQQQLLQQQRLASGAAPKPKAKAKAKSRAASKGTAAVQRPIQSGNCTGDGVSLPGYEEISLGFCLGHSVGFMHVLTALVRQPIHVTKSRFCRRRVRQQLQEESLFLLRGSYLLRMLLRLLLRLCDRTSCNSNWGSNSNAVVQLPRVTFPPYSNNCYNSNFSTRCSKPSNSNFFSSYSSNNISCCSSCSSSHLSCTTTGCSAMPATNGGGPLIRSQATSGSAE